MLFASRIVKWSVCLLLALLCLPAIGAQTNGFTVVIDAGHGGFDGGAIADDQTIEKDLNRMLNQSSDHARLELSRLLFYCMDRRKEAEVTSKVSDEMMISCNRHLLIRWDLDFQ